MAGNTSTTARLGKERFSWRKGTGNLRRQKHFFSREGTEKFRRENSSRRERVGNFQRDFFFLTGRDGFVSGGL